jgi:dTDP-4-dehydrorhamnose 3,5-epimerase
VIRGVETKRLTAHEDERGFFMELARVNADPFFRDPGVVQVSTAVRRAGVVAWHLHPTQVDWWLVIAGEIRAAVLDRRESSDTRGRVDEFVLKDDPGDAVVLKIPAGVAHGYKVIRGPARLLYLASRTYDRAEELRLDPRDPELARIYDWDK